MLKHSLRMEQFVRAICKEHDFDPLAGDGSTMKVENEPFMPLLITALLPHRVSVAHYYIQMGDVVYDPEIVFYSPEGTDLTLYPFAVTQPPMMIAGREFGGYREYVEFDESGKPVRFIRYQQHDLATFANQWAANLRSQGFLESNRVIIR